MPHNPPMRSSRCCGQYGEVGPITLTAHDIADMRAAAQSLLAVFAAEDVDRAAASLNRLLSGTGTLRLSSLAAPLAPTSRQRRRRPVG